MTPQSDRQVRLFVLVTRSHPLLHLNLSARAASREVVIEIQTYRITIETY